jgi:hypothetical protein
VIPLDWSFSGTIDPDHTFAYLTADGGFIKVNLSSFESQLIEGPFTPTYNTTIAVDNTVRYLYTNDIFENSTIIYQLTETLTYYDNHTLAEISNASVVYSIFIDATYIFVIAGPYGQDPGATRESILCRIERTTPFNAANHECITIEDVGQFTFSLFYKESLFFGTGRGQLVKVDLSPTFEFKGAMFLAAQNKDICTYDGGVMPRLESAAIISGSRAIITGGWWGVFFDVDLDSMFS